MTARITVNGELRVHGREVEILVKPGWTSADLQAAAALEGAPVRFTIEPIQPAPEPLTGGDADINVRVRIKRTWVPGSALSGKIGVLAGYSCLGYADIRDPDTGGYWAVPPDQIERAPTECPHCGASQVTP